jgi:hypothetical protein
MTGGTFTEAANQFLTRTGAMVLQKPVLPEELQRVIAGATHDRLRAQAAG